MQPSEQPEGEGSERVAKRRRTDSHDRTSGCNTPAAFAEPLYAAGTVLPIPLKNQDGSDWNRFISSVVCAHDGGWFVGSPGRITRVSSDGVVSPFVGDPEYFDDTDGVSDAARFSEEIGGLALSTDGGTLFVADTQNHKIRKVDVATGAVTTFAGSGEDGSVNGSGAAAAFRYPCVACLSADGATLFVSDFCDHKIRQVDVATGAVTTLAGSGGEGNADGVGAAAAFDRPIGNALSTDGATLFVADTTNHKIRQVDVATGAITTLAGSKEEGSVNGSGAAAQFRPHQLALSSDGATLFIADVENDKISQLDVATGVVTTLVECDELDSVVVDPNGTELMVNCAQRLLRVKLKTNTMEPLVIPPSTLASDCGKLCGDKDLPVGMVNFVVGPEQHRIEHVAKNFLSVRSEYFFKMFRGGLGEYSGDTITVPDANPTAFQSLMNYLLTDNATVDTSTGHAWGVMELARKYQVKRLELLCLQAIEGSLAPQNAVQLLEGAHSTQNERLFAQCRHYITEHSVEAKRGGGLEELQGLGVARGLLGDAIDRCEQLQQRLSVLEKGDGF